MPRAGAAPPPAPPAQQQRNPMPQIIQDPVAQQVAQMRQDITLMMEVMADALPDRPAQAGGRRARGRNVGHGRRQRQAQVPINLHRQRGQPQAPAQHHRQAGNREDKIKIVAERSPNKRVVSVVIDA